MNVERPHFAAFWVKDLEASVRFYRDGLGIPLERDQQPPHEEVSWHDPYFHFALIPKEEEQPPALGLPVEDLEAAHTRLLEVGAEVVKAPFDAPWGRDAWYHDPDGNLISLV